MQIVNTMGLFVIFTESQAFFPYRSTYTVVSEWLVKNNQIIIYKSLSA